MSEVHAVKNDNQREQVEYLLQQRPAIYYDIWKVGVNVGLRISDLLALTMEQASRLSTSEQDTLRMRERKTDKSWNVTFNQAAITVLKRRLAQFPNDKYLFQLHNPKNRKRIAPTPISRRSVGREFERAGKLVHPPVLLGTHSMRKTRGYAMHKAGMPIEEVCQNLGHASPKATMAYIGLDAETLRRSFLDFEL